MRWAESATAKNATDKNATRLPSELDHFLFDLRGYLIIEDAIEPELLDALNAAFDEFPDRFMVGTDTFTPERWHYVGEHSSWSRAWLASLPKPLAERIAWRNGEALFADAIAKRGM